jgi:hypothetical protein
VGLPLFDAFGGKEKEGERRIFLVAFVLFVGFFV